MPSNRPQRMFFAFITVIKRGGDLFCIVCDDRWIVFTTKFDSDIMLLIEHLQSADREEVGEKPTLYSATVNMLRHVSRVVCIWGVYANLCVVEPKGSGRHELQALYFHF